MISRYTPLGLLLILLFFGCRSFEVKKESSLEQNDDGLVNSNIELTLDEKINKLILEHSDETKFLLDSILEIVDDSLEYNELIARLEFSLGNYKGAKSRISESPGFSDDVESLKFYLICQTALLEDYSETVNKILELDPGNSFALNLLAKDLINSKELDKAEEKLLLSYKSNPKNSDTFVLLGDLFVAKVDAMNLGKKRVLTSNEDIKVTVYYEEALKYYLKAKVESDASYFVKLSTIYKKLGNKFEAVKALSRAIELDPDDVWNYYDRGKLYFYLSSNSKALEDLNTAYDMDPNHFFTNVFLGRIYFMENILDKSLLHYNKALAINPDYYPAYKELSVLYYTSGDLEKSIIYLIKLYNSRSDTDQLLPLYMVTSLIENNRTEDAKKLLANLVKYEKTGTMKGIYSYLYSPKSTNDQVLTDALNIEDNYQRIRLTYYVATALHFDGVEALSQTLFKEVAESGISYESKLAAYKLGDRNE